MKKIAFALAATLIASPAFAARSVTIARLVEPLTSLTASGSSSSTRTVPPFSEAYSFDLPGLGKGGSPQSFNMTFPALGTLKVNFQNTGKGGTLSYSESLSNQ